MILYIKIAGVKIRINSIYRTILTQCEGYTITECNPEISVSISEEDLVYEEKKNNVLSGTNESEMCKILPCYLETLAIHRKIVEKLIPLHTFLIHGSLIGYNHSAVLLTAASGVGKTTATKKLLEQYPEAFVINGDKPLLRIDNKNQKCIAFGTPWCGKEKMNRNTSAPLRKIVILKRGEKEELKRISSSEAFPILFQQTYRSNDTEKLKLTLQFLSDVVKNVELWQYTMKYYDDLKNLVVAPVLE